MADHLADPGGVFDSDTHRRVAGYLPLPGDDPILFSVDNPLLGARELRRVSLGHRISGDHHHGLADMDDLAQVLDDLAADGYAAETAKGWKLTKEGLAALQAPLPAAPEGPATPALLGGL